MNARDFALERHGDQRWGPLIYPYVEHLDRVASFFPKDTIEGDVSYLHDTLEDTETTFEELVVLFGMPVARNVQLLTKYPGLDIFKYYQAIYCHPVARVVKLADLEVNISQFIVNLNTLPNNNGWGKETERKVRNYAHYIVYLTTGKWVVPKENLETKIPPVKLSVVEHHLMQPGWENFPPQVPE